MKKAQADRAQAGRQNALAANPPRAATNSPQGTGNSGSRVTDPDSARFNALLAEQQSLYSKLRYLGEQLRIDGLKHQYTPAGPPAAVPSSILPFQLQQQTLAPATH